MREIMTSPVVYVTPQNTLDECMGVKTRHLIRHLPILHAKRVVGVVSIGDLVKWIISEQEVTIRQLEHYIMGPSLGLTRV